MSVSESDIAFESKRLVFRTWQDKDREPYAAMNADPRGMEFLSGTLTREQSDMAIAALQRHFEIFGYGLWVVERRATGAFVGTCGFTNLSGKDAEKPMIEATCRFLPKFWIGGLAMEAGLAGLKHGFEKLKFSEVFTYCCKNHATAQRYNERIGMTRLEHADFMHPLFPDGHPMKPHVLYTITAEQFAAQESQN